jgi:signal transduction histidine kinase
MGTTAQFFDENIVYVYFFYGLAFFSLGLVVLLESGRASEFRFARALRPLALFGFIHGLHEWFEMFQIFAVRTLAYQPGPVDETFRLLTLLASFLVLLIFGVRLLPGAEDSPRREFIQVTLMALLWLAAVVFVAWLYDATWPQIWVAADVLARYGLAIPGSALAALALIRERHDFHARGMSQYGRSLLWAALAFLIYGVFGQLFVRSSLIFPSQTINSAMFLRMFGVPIQLLRTVSALAITVALGSALRAFELESRFRLARANKARIEAQAAALEAQQRRANEVEALNVRLSATASELSAMVQLSHILTSTIDLRPMLSSALYQIVHSFDRACCSIVLLRRPDGGLELTGEYRRPNAARPMTLPPITAVVARAVEANGPAGAGLDGKIVLLTDEAELAERRFRTLGVPLRSQVQILGGLALSSVREEEPLGSDELSLLTAFAQQIAASVENARLYQVVQERENQLEDLVRQLVTAQEGERQRIARELHDETGQKLLALNMGLAAVDTQLTSGDAVRATSMVRNLRELNDLAVSELRNIMADLRPAQLDDLGLVPALRWYIQQYQTRQPSLSAVLLADRTLPRLPAQHETVLFRIAQEALTNVARHARATEVTVTLSRTGDRICLEISDNGQGFDTSAPPRHEPHSGLGLVGMRERVALVRGELLIESEPGHGTRIMVRLPLGGSGVTQDE